MSDKRLHLSYTVVIDSMGIGLILPVMPDLIQKLRAPAWCRGGVGRNSRDVLQSCSSCLDQSSGTFLTATDDVDLDLVGRNGAGLPVDGCGRYHSHFDHRTDHWRDYCGHPINRSYSRHPNHTGDFGGGAAFGVGFVLGPLMGGVLAEFGTRARLCGSRPCRNNAVFGYFVLPETVIRNQAPFTWMRANPLGRSNTSAYGWRLLSISFLYEVAFFVLAFGLISVRNVSVGGPV